MRTYKSHIKTPKSVTIVFTEGDPVTIPAESDSFKQICHLLSEGLSEDACTVADIAMKVAVRSGGKFELDKETMTVVETATDQAMPEALSRKLMELVNAGHNTKSLENFWGNLKENPSEESRKDLYEFLMANKIPITDDGHFVGYKSVRNDYLDAYSGKISNKPGTVVKIDRKDVDSNRQQTCSYGLHVGAYSYASTYSQLLLEVKVNPRDVVSVPPDYNQQKMRVCRYEVVGLSKLGEHQVPLYNPKAKDFLALDGRGRLQVSKAVLKDAGLSRVKKLAVRVDPRAPGQIRIAPYKGMGLGMMVTRLGIYVPKEIIEKADLASERSFHVVFKRGGITLSKE